MKLQSELAVIVGIRAARIAWTVELILAVGKEEFAARRILAEAGHFVLGYEQVEL